MSVQLDDHAVRMLHLVARPIVDIVHDGDIDEAAKAVPAAPQQQAAHRQRVGDTDQ